MVWSEADISAIAFGPVQYAAAVRWSPPGQNRCAAQATDTDFGRASIAADAKPLCAAQLQSPVLISSGPKSSSVPNPKLAISAATEGSEPMNHAQRSMPIARCWIFAVPAGRKRRLPRKRPIALQANVLPRRSHLFLRGYQGLGTSLWDTRMVLLACVDSWHPLSGGVPRMRAAPAVI